MKVLFTGDWHADASTAGFERFDDVRHAAYQMVAYAGENDVGLVVFGGDLCDPDSPNLIRCMGLASEIALLLHMDDIDSLWLAGNHDVLEDGHGTTTLDLVEHGGRVATPGLANIAGIDVACLPYTALARSYDPVRELERMSREVDASKVKFVVTHLMLEGISVGSETEDFPRGRDVFFPIDDAKRLFPNAVLVANHYHAAQSFRGVHIPGALIRLTRADADRVPGFLEIEV